MPNKKKINLTETKIQNLSDQEDEYQKSESKRRNEEKVLRVFEIKVEPRYMLFNVWERLDFEGLPKNVQKLYLEQGIPHWMEKNIKHALRDLNIEPIIVDIDKKTNVMTIRVSLKLSDLKNNCEDTEYCCSEQTGRTKRRKTNKKKENISEDAQLFALRHFIEQKQDMGSDWLSWAYGVRVGAIINDEDNHELASMVFEILDLNELPHSCEKKSNK
jgi:hypothetical protein